MFRNFDIPNYFNKISVFPDITDIFGRASCYNLANWIMLSHLKRNNLQKRVLPAISKIILKEI